MKMDKSSESPPPLVDIFLAYPSLIKNCWFDLWILRDGDICYNPSSVYFSVFSYFELVTWRFFCLITLLSLFQQMFIEWIIMKLVLGYNWINEDVKEIQIKKYFTGYISVVLALKCDINIINDNKNLALF